MSKIDRILREKRAYSFEGESGVKKLCGVLEEATDTTDPMHFGQHEHGSYGVLINFLESNPGACNAIMDFVRDHFDEDEDEDEEECEDEEERIDMDDCIGFNNWKTWFVCSGKTKKG